MTKPERARRGTQEAGQGQRPENTASSVEERFSLLEERFTWIQKVGWGIAGVYAVVFTGLLTWYLPKELQSSRNQMNSDVERTVAPIRQDLAVLTERIRKQVGFSIQSLVPPANLARTIDPIVLDARFQETSSLVNAAISERIPANPALLRDSRTRLAATVQDVRLSKQNRSSAIAALVDLNAYEVFSAAVIAVNVPKVVISASGTTHAPVTISRTIWLEGTGKHGATLTVDFSGTHSRFPHSAAFVVTGGDTVLSNMSVKGKEANANFLALTSRESRALVMESAIENLTQNLGGVTWVNVAFENAIIRYNGEPLYLSGTTFKNCKFEFGDDPVSKSVLVRISQSPSPMTLASTTF